MFDFAPDQLLNVAFFVGIQGRDDEWDSVLARLIEKGEVVSMRVQVSPNGHHRVDYRLQRIDSGNVGANGPGKAVDCHGADEVIVDRCRSKNRRRDVMRASVSMPCQCPVGDWGGWYHRAPIPVAATLKLPYSEESRCEFADTVKA